MHRFSAKGHEIKKTSLYSFPYSVSQETFEIAMIESHYPFFRFKASGLVFEQPDFSLSCREEPS